MFFEKETEIKKVSYTNNNEDHLSPDDVDEEYLGASDIKFFSEHRQYVLTYPSVTSVIGGYMVLLILLLLLVVLLWELF